MVNSSQPERFGRYKVAELLGAGAMGSVYLARDEELHREVAIKTLRTRDLPAFAAEMSSARFENEARAIASLRHPHIVEVFDKGVQDGTPYLVMELAAHGSLADRIKAESAEPVPVSVVSAVAVQIAGALEAAHGRGIIHRDVKPANILEMEPGIWKLADFGVARVPDASMTLTGQFLGSPAYAAPEAIQRGEVSPATDVYGLGATLYQALIGEPPYGPRGLMTPGALASDDPPEAICARRSGVPAYLEAVILRAVGRKISDRPSAAQLAAAAAPPGPGYGQTLGSGYGPGFDATTGFGATAGLIATPSHPAAISRLSHTQRKKLFIGAGIFGALILGVVIGSSGGDPSDYPPSSPALPGAAVWSQPGTSYQGDAEYEKQWDKIRERLEEGKYHDVEKRLHKLLRKYPDDERAYQLLQQLQNHDYDD